MAHPEDLGQLRGDHDDRLALLGEVVEEPVDLALGPHVDAPRGLVEDEDVGVGGQPLGDDHLLLVAAGQVLHPLGDPRRLDREGRDLLQGLLPGGARPDPAEPVREAAQRGEHGVDLDVHAEGQAVALAILGEVGDPVLDRVARRADRDRLAVDQDLAGLRPVGGEDGAHDLGPAGPDEAGDAEDLAAMELEADVPHLAAEVEAAHLEHDRRVDRLGQLGRRLEDGPPDHHADDLLDAGLGRVDRVDVAAVPHDRHAVGDPLELLQAVRDVHDAVAALAQVAGDAEELVDLGLGERRRRLVHDQDVRVVGQRLGDLHHLLLGDGEPGHARRRVELQVELLEQLGGLAVERPVVQQDAAARLPPDEDVLGHGQVAHEVQLLVDDADAEVLGGARRGDLHLAALDPDRAGVPLVDPGEDLHQRGLARAVLAHQRVDLAGAQLEARVLERLDAREALGDVGHLDQEIAHHGSSAEPLAMAGAGAGVIGFGYR